MILKSEHGEYINLDQIGVYELQDGNVLLIKDTSNIRKFTLTKSSAYLLEEYLNSQEIE